MKKSPIGLAVTLALTLLMTAQFSLGAPRQWELDKGHSGIYFSVGHIFSKVHGHFNEFDVDVKFDPDNLAESRFSFKIKTDSIDTNISKRDKHLQSADFFDAGKHPYITFESESINDMGNNVYEVKGKLTVKGQVYDFTLPLGLAGVKAHPMSKGKDVTGFNGAVTLDRLAYKIGNGKFADLGVVGKEVDVAVTLELLSPQ